MGGGGARLAIVIQARDEARAILAGVEGSLRALGGAASAPVRALSALTDTLGRIGLAGMGIQTIADQAMGLGRALLSGNAELENTRAQLLAFTKSGEQADAILAMIRSEADKTPFAFQEMAAATAGLIPAARSAGEDLMSLVRTAEILAASHPEQGLQGAAFALREAVSGDFTSIVERFDLPRQYINQLKEQGVPALEIVRRAMQQMGYDADLVGNLAQTLSGRWSTFLDTLNSVKDRASQPIFAALSQTLADAQGWLDANRDAIDNWAATVAAAFGLAIDGVRALASGFASGLGSVLEIVSSIGQAIYEALSWINPFATHSPALVDQVKDGVREIVQSYQDVGAIASPLDYAGQAVQDFAGRSKDAVRDLVEATRDDLDAMKDALAAAKDELRSWTEVPIQGTKEFEDRLYAIEVEIDKAQLAASKVKLARPDPKNKQAMEQYRAAVQAAQDNVQRLRDEAEALKLEEKIKLEPLRKQLKNLAKGEVAEQPFEKIAAGIKEAKGKIDVLEPAVKRQEALWKAQSKAMQEVAGAARSAGSAVAGMAAGVGAAGPLKGIADAVQLAKQQTAEWGQKVATARMEIEKTLEPARRLWAAIFGESQSGTDPSGAIVERRVGGVVNGIREAFQRGGVGEVVSVITGWLGAEVAKVDWAQVWVNVKSIASGIGQKGWDVVTEVTGWLGQQWAKIDWAQVWANVKSIASGIGQGAWNIVADVTSWLGRQVATIPWSSVWGTVKDVSAGIGGAAWDVVTSLTGWLGNQVNKIDWAVVWGTVKNAGAGLQLALGNGEALVQSVTAWLGAQMAQVNWQMVFEKLPAWDAALAAWINQQDFTQSGEAFSAKIREVIGSVFSSAALARVLAGLGIASGLYPILAAVGWTPVAWAAALIAPLIMPDTAIAVAKAVYQFGKGMAEDIIDAIYTPLFGPEPLARLITWVEKLGQDILAQEKAVVKAAQGLGEGIIEGMVAGLAGMNLDIISAISAELAKVKIDLGPFHLSAAGFRMDMPISAALPSAMPAVGPIPGYAAGGIVPGPIGQPQLAVVHGGETITPPGRSGSSFVFSGTINISAPGGNPAEVIQATRDGVLQAARALGLAGM